MSSLDAERHRLRLEQIEADRQRAEDAVKHARTPAASPVAEGFDRTGMPPIDQLARYEENAKLRFSPRRLRWKDVQELDERATALETRINEVAGELNEARTRLANADTADADALAAWFANDSKGPRPEPTKSAFGQRVRELEIEHAALGRNLDKALRDKAAYIEKHRGRLAKLARRHVEQEQANTLRLIDELRAARDDLVAARESELWLACFGTDHANTMPNSRLLAGARRDPLMRAGIHAQVDAERVFDAFVADVRWLGEMATVEQAQGAEHRAARPSGARGRSVGRRRRRQGGAAAGTRAPAPGIHPSLGAAAVVTYGS